MRLKTRVIIAGIVIGLCCLGSHVIIYVAPRQLRLWDDLGKELNFWELLYIRICMLAGEFYFLIFPPIILAAVLFVILPVLWKAGNDSDGP